MDFLIFFWGAGSLPALENVELGPPLLITSLLLLAHAHSKINIAAAIRNGLKLVKCLLLGGQVIPPQCFFFFIPKHPN